MARLWHSCLSDVGMALWQSISARRRPAACPRCRSTHTPHCIKPFVPVASLAPAVGISQSLLLAYHLCGPSTVGIFFWGPQIDQPDENQTVIDQLPEIRVSGMLYDGHPGNN